MPILVVVIIIVVPKHVMAYNYDKNYNSSRITTLTARKRIQFFIVDGAREKKFKREKRRLNAS